MTRAVHAELVKLLTTRLWWGLLLGVVALVALNVVPTALFAGQTQAEGIPAVPPLDEVAGVTAVYGAGYQAGYLLAMVLGVIVGAADFRHRTATATYLATPSRSVVIAAKAVVAAAAGLLYGVVAQVATVAVAAPVVLARGGELRLGEPEVLRSLVLGVAGVALWGVLGAALGVLLRNQVAAILVGVGYIFLGDLLVSGLFALADLDGAARFTPVNASSALVEGFTGFQLLPWWGGALVLLAYGAVLAAAGWVVGRRRDVM